MTVDILVTGLDATGVQEIISAFDFDVRYDPAILELAGATFGTELSSGTSSSLQDSASTPGVVDLAEVSLLSDVALESVQPGSFRLATLSFNAIKTGSSPLTFVSGE